VTGAAERAKMMSAKVFRWVILLGAIFIITPVALAQSNPHYIRFAGVPNSVKGALYAPDAPQKPPHIGILVMHRASNFMNALACPELSKRGYLVLCMNPRSDNNEALVRWETIPLDVKAGVEFLKKQPGISKILLWGFSGGGPTMTFYQNVAENGVSVCQGRNKLVQCGNELVGLPRADGLVLVDAHPGNPVNGVRSINPAVTDENRPDLLNPEIDPYNPKNGYNSNGPSSYSEAFKAKYFRAQAERMNRLIDKALAMERLLKEGKYYYSDDDVFVIVRGENARLMQLDMSIHSGTVKPRKLLKNDGTIVTEVVKSVRVPNLRAARQNGQFENGARLLTVKSFLSANAVRATDSMDGIDHCSSNNSPPCHLPTITVPTLVSAMGGHYFIRDNELHFELAGAKDKDFIVVEGAEHGQTPCVPCETTPGQYSNSVKNFYDYVRQWIDKRF
jgi:hypothetical protein